jgi:hypothetical protein
MNKFDIGDEVRVVNSWDETSFNLVGTVKEKYGNDYLIVFKDKGMKIFYESELMLFNKKYEVEKNI